MEKIDFKNGQTSASAETMLAFQTNIDNAIKEKNIATRKFSRQNVTVSQDWGSAKIVFSDFSFIGDKLKSDLNGIKIGPGISKILVSAQCAGIGNNIVVGDKQFIIKKTGANKAIGNSYLGGGVVVNFMNLCISPILIDVSENDILSLEVSSGSKGTFEILEGQLTVEAVKG